MEVQKRFDFSRRGGQLQILERVRLPFPASRKAVLKAIDDAIGKDSEWTISLARMARAAGLSKGTVSKAVADLASLNLIDVQDRYRRTAEGGVERLPSTFRIVWSNLPDFIPEVNPEPVASDGSVVFVQRRCDASGESGSGVFQGGVSETQGGVSQNRGVFPQETGGVSLGNGGVSELNGGCFAGKQGVFPDCMDPVQSEPDQPVPSPSRDPVDDAGEGTDSVEGDRLVPDRATAHAVWRSVCDAPDVLRRAVKNSDPVLIGSLWRSGVVLGWVPDDRDLRRRFLAACYYVTLPPDGFEVKNAGKLLRWKTQERDWTTGNGDGSDDDWAGQMQRRIEGTDKLPRMRSRSLFEVDQQERDRQMNRLREVANG